MIFPFSVENCGANNVLLIDSNFTADLSDDCIVVTKGCLLSKGFKEAKVGKHEISTSHNKIVKMV